VCASVCVCCLCKLCQVNPVAETKSNQHSKDSASFEVAPARNNNNNYFAQRPHNITRLLVGKVKGG